MYRRIVVISLVLLPVLIAACGRGESTEPPPGLDPGEEIVLVEVDPAPSDDFLIWESAYQVDGLPVVNVGRVTPEFLESAGRQGDDPEDYECVGDSSGSSGCGIDEGEPALSGITFGGSEIRAWSWQFIPEEAIVVRFTDQEGKTRWQRPQSRLVIFPNTVDNDMDGNCPDCRLDAIDNDGNVIGSASVDTFASTDG